MILTLNGEQRDDLAAATVADLLEELGLGTRPVAVMVNGEVVRRAEQAGHRLSDGDSVEVISLIGGG
ncbi:MAG: sulfur carrier protein ThiS [Sumerlaeia bacterium]